MDNVAGSRSDTSSLSPNAFPCRQAWSTECRNEQAHRPDRETGLTDHIRQRAALLLAVISLLLAALACSLSPKVSVRAGNGLERVSVTVLAVDPTSSPATYAGTSEGVFTSTDDGESWRSVGLTGTYVYDLAIDPVVPTTLYAGTDQGMFRSTNGGETWSVLRTDLTDPSDPGIRILMVDPLSPSTLYAATGDDQVLKSTDGGVSWTTANTGLANTYVHALAIDPTTPTTLYAGTYGEGVFKSTDAGLSWRPVNNEGLRDPHVRILAIDPATPTTIYAAGLGMFKSADGGESWSTAELTSVDVTALAIHPTTPTTLYAGTPTGRVLSSTDGGESWSALNIHLPEDIIGDLLVDPASPATLIIGMTRNGVFVATIP